MTQRSKAVTFIAVLVACAGCASEGRRIPEVEATGPPTVELDQVQRHADQFDLDVPERPAGSQNEQAASVYLLGHLQQAGYVVLLDSVPAGDLVRSTNVVAAPPSGEDPSAVVAVPYDTSESHPSNGVALGLLLETARALRVAVPDHSVEFVALGAEHLRRDVSNLGSRRLAQELIDDDLKPSVILIDRIAPGSEFSARGPLAPEIEAAAGKVEVDSGNPPAPGPGDEVWRDARRPYVYVAGSAEDVALALMEFLAETAR